MKKMLFILMQTVLRLLQFAYKLGARSKLSGWRKSMGVYLRREESKFILTAFNLNMGSKKEFIEHLIKELRNDIEMQWCVVWDRNIAHRVRNEYIDIMEVTFAKEGNIVHITPYFDNNNPIEIEDSELNYLINQFIIYYNQTLELSDEIRPLVLQKLCYSNPISKRILSAHIISFSEQLDNKFIPVNFINMKHFGLGLLNIHARLTKDSCDLWVQYQHIAVDGVPMQQFLNRLTQHYRDVPVTFPEPTETFPIQRCSKERGKNTIYQTIQFTQFHHMITFRKRLNETHHSQMEGKATFASLLIWALGNSDTFRGEKFMFPVEVPADELKGLDREPSGIFIRPSDFFDKTKPFDGLLDFQYEFNSQMEATRLRQSEGYKMIEYFSLLPATLYKLPPLLIPETVNEFIGSVGLTMLRDGDIFIPPSPIIQPKGFFAVGNLTHQTTSNKTVGCVGIRTTKGFINSYTKTLKEINKFYKHLLDNFNA